MNIGLYLVTDTRLCGGPRGVIETAVAAARGGVDMVQLRDHDASTRDLAQLAKELIDALRPWDVPVVIDDRLDVALAVGADGVHLGQQDLDPIDARRIAHGTEQPFHIGWSISREAHAERAAALPDGTIDLVGIGPFRATTTKPDADTPLGLDGVWELSSAVPMPNVVIGGVTNDDVPALVSAGANGVAVVSAICGRPDPEAATAQLRATIDHALAHRGGHA